MCGQPAKFQLSKAACDHETLSTQAFTGLLGVGGAERERHVVGRQYGDQQTSNFQPESKYILIYRGLSVSSEKTRCLKGGLP
jgi:hypothetical protein